MNFTPMGLELRLKGFLHVIHQVENRADKAPNWPHVRSHFLLQFLQICAQLHQALLPLDKELVLNREAKPFQPLPDGMGLGIVSTAGVGQEIANVFDSRRDGTANLLSNTPANGKQRADRRLGLWTEHFLSLSNGQHLISPLGFSLTTGRRESLPM